MSEQYQAPEPEESTWGDEAAEAADASGADDDAGGKTIGVRIRKQDYEVTFDFLEMTPRLWKKVQAQDESFEGYTEFILTLVTRWTLTDKRGNPIPLTEEGLEGVSLKTMDAVAAAIWKSVSPKSTADAA